MAKYKELQDKLDVAIGQLESGGLGVDEAVKAYEDALKIIKQLETHLQSAENRVTELAKTYGDPA
jgi:exodeoxyribonuclease VII small subunit